MAGRVLTETAAPTSRIDWPAALKESGLAAFVALVLFLPLVGMQTIKIEGGVGLHFRFDWVLIGVALVAVGRLLLVGLRTVQPGTIASVTAPVTRIPALLAPYAGFLVAAGLVFAFVLPLLPFANRYVVDIATTVLIYVMLGWGSTSWSASPGCWISATSRSTPSAPTPTRCSPDGSIWASGNACRWPARWPPRSASCWGSRCSGCAVTTSRS